jgi:uncharacterized protein YndB with AHSA1/START domain
LTEIRADTEIDAPREEVFDLLLDPNRLDDWVNASRGVADVSDDPLEIGSSFRQMLRVGGAPFHVQWRVVELERPSLVVWEGEGPGHTKARVRYELSENGAGTRFRYSNRYDLPGGLIGAAAGGVGAGPAKRVMNHSLRNLKRLLESGGGD